MGGPGSFLGFHLFYPLLFYSVAAAILSQAHLGPWPSLFTLIHLSHHRLIKFSVSPVSHSLAPRTLTVGGAMLSLGPQLPRVRQKSNTIY